MEKLKIWVASNPIVASLTMLAVGMGAFWALTKYVFKPKFGGYRK